MKRRSRRVAPTVEAVEAETKDLRATLKGLDGDIGDLREVLAAVTVDLRVFAERLKGATHG